MIAYTLRRRSRMRSIRLAVHIDGSVIVSAAKSVPVIVIERMLQDRHDWIELQRQKMATRIRVAPSASVTDYKRYKVEALRLVQDRTSHFSLLYGFQPKRISIGNARTRWGSCSRHGSLNFSYRVIFLSPELRDYLIVHELCHLKEFNHSRRFWALVEKIVPNYRLLRKQLKFG